MTRLVDTHCHVDLYPDYASVIDEAEAAGVYTVAVTNTPSVFPKMRNLIGGRKYLRAALGLHAELAVARQGELDVFRRLLPQTKYVGEVGLDYARGRAADHAVQRRVFTEILTACASAPERKILTVHSRRAADDVVAAIGERFPARVILHWFTGSLTTLERAIANGYYFSANVAMSASTSGRRIVAAIPKDRLLTESDGPFVASSTGVGMRPTDIAVALKVLGDTRGVSADELRRTVYKNLSTLLRE
jgi:TatD DNase family protein